MKVYLSPRRVDDIFHLLPIFSLGKMVPYIQFLRLLGGLTAASAVVPLGLLSLRPMQMWLNSLHLDAKWHRHRKVRVSQRCRHSLLSWRDRAYLLMGVPMGAIPSRRETVTNKDRSRFSTAEFY
ncbi:DNA gyrase subunit A [Dissostichus eleginoides]|uniref:DNA gyrase subunit A n=1 Tax=Dissostichus eleginoides TaxID=100907 RepID=A0AAD9B4Z3_DISEL|nr:DNA gyrase subunit A [Dissostichus eleginoides]